MNKAIIDISTYEDLKKDSENLRKNFLIMCYDSPFGSLYSYKGKDEIIKEITKTNEDLINKYQNILNETQKIKKMSLFKFLKWRKNK